MMASSRHYQNGSTNALIVMLIFSLTILPSNSGESEGLKEMKMVLGSRPPQCVNRCLGCRPCMAALVIHHPHLENTNNNNNGFKATSAPPDETYYLLSWKCRCKDKYFQP